MTPNLSRSIAGPPPGAAEDAEIIEVAIGALNASPSRYTGEMNDDGIIAIIEDGRAVVAELFAGDDDIERITATLWHYESGEPLERFA